MTRDQYLQLVQSSAAFHGLPPDMQQHILEAAGSLMQAYARIFLDEQKLLLDAKQEFLRKNEEIIHSMTAEVKKLKKEKRLKCEQISQESDEQEEQKLLAAMDRL